MAEKVLPPCEPSNGHLTLAEVKELKEENGLWHSTTKLSSQNLYTCSYTSTIVKNKMMFVLK